LAELLKDCNVAASYYLEFRTTASATAIKRVKVALFFRLSASGKLAACRPFHLAIARAAIPIFQVAIIALFVTGYVFITANDELTVSITIFSLHSVASSAIITLFAALHFTIAAISEGLWNLYFGIVRLRKRRERKKNRYDQDEMPKRSVIHFIDLLE
jgi:hypothetical protein